VQTHTDYAIRGRVMGIYLTIFMGGTPFGSPLIGYLMEEIGVRKTVFLCGSIALVAVAITYYIFKDKVERPNDLRVSSVLSVEEDYSEN
jgi:predicted MFS family arabinose efflux permease